MQEASRFLLFTHKLNQLGVQYMVTGSVAAMIYGEPRLTADVDIVVTLKKEDALRISECFPIEEFYCPPLEVIRVEAARSERGQFNIIHHETGFKADLYMAGKDPLNAWGFENLRRIEFLGETVLVSPPELVILRKLEFFREGGSEKHVRDICAMLQASPDKINRAKLEELIDARGLQQPWARILKELQ